MKNFINKIKKFLNQASIDEKVTEKTNDKKVTNEEKTTELKILRRQNFPNEKQRIMELYYRVNDGEVDLESIEYEDLIKIRKLLLEEAKMRDKLLDEDLVELMSLVRASNISNS